MQLENGGCKSFWRVHWIGVIRGPKNEMDLSWETVDVWIMMYNPPTLSDRYLFSVLDRLISVVSLNTPLEEIVWAPYYSKQWLLVSANHYSQCHECTLTPLMKCCQAHAEVIMGCLFSLTVPSKVLGRRIQSPPSPPDDRRQSLQFPLDVSRRPRALPFPAFCSEKRTLVMLSFLSSLFTYVV